MGKRVARVRPPRQGVPGGPWRALPLALPERDADALQHRLARRGDAASAPDLEAPRGAAHDARVPGFPHGQELAKHRSRSCSPPAPAARSHFAALLRGVSTAPVRGGGAGAAEGGAGCGRSACVSHPPRRRGLVRVLGVACTAVLALLAVLRWGELQTARAWGAPPWVRPLRGGSAAAARAAAKSGPWEWAHDPRGVLTNGEPWNPYPDSGGTFAVGLPRFDRDGRPLAGGEEQGYTVDDGGDGGRAWFASARTSITRAARTFRGWLACDPLAELLPDGPLAWYYDWAAHGGVWPERLWDPAALVARAPWPLGSATQLCNALGGGSVALVGNGPLMPAQRAEIAAAGAVVRFNAVNNWRAPGQPDSATAVGLQAVAGLQALRPGEEIES